MFTSLLVFFNNSHFSIKNKAFFAFAAFFGAALLSYIYSSAQETVRNGLLVLFDCVVAAFFFTLLPVERKKALVLIPALISFFFVFLISSKRGIPAELLINPNLLAGYFVISLPLSFNMWERNTKAGIVLSAAIFWGLLLTASRISIIVSGISVLAYLFVNYRRSRVFLLPGLAALAAIVYIVSAHKEAVN
jgi:hypothetical protein